MKSLSLSQPPKSKLLFCLTLPLVIAVRVALWLVPFSSLRHLPKWLATRIRWRPRPAWPPERIARYVRYASRFVPGATCLTQALATETLLRQAGRDCRLRIGVAKEHDGTLIAHAWVECEGRIVIGGSRASVARYAPLPDLDRRVTWQ